VQGEQHSKIDTECHPALDAGSRKFTGFLVKPGMTIKNFKIIIQNLKLFLSFASSFEN
jgi:hypothetical protein